MDSRKFGSAVLATTGIADEHLDAFTRVAGALNKNKPWRAAAMADLLKQAFSSLDAAAEALRPKTLAERFAAFPESLKAKLTLDAGRLYFTVVGAGIESKHWPERLKAGGHELSKWAKDVLSKPDYDAKHRLVVGKDYKLALALGTEFATDAQRTTADVKVFARGAFGDQSVDGLKGELALLIREKFTNAELELMGIYYIAVLHEPIVDSDGSPFVLGSDRNDGSFVNAFYAHPRARWDDDGAFAFLAK